MSVPTPEPVEVAPGGSTNWAEMTPGQRATFIAWSRTRGWEPCAGVDYYSDQPPEMCAVDPSAPGMANLIRGVSLPLPGNLNPWVWAALGLLLLALVLYAGGRTARRFVPI